MVTKGTTLKQNRTVTYSTEGRPTKFVQSLGVTREIESGRTGVNVTVNQVRDNSLGYILLRNDLHTIDSPFVVTENTPFVFPLRNDSGVYHQAPSEFQNIIDNDTNKIVVINTWDKWSYSLQFTLKTALNDRFGSTIFNIGGNIEDFTPSYFDGSRNADVPKIISIPLEFFQGETFTANGGQIVGKLDGTGEIYNLRIIATRDVTGKAV